MQSASVEQQRRLLASAPTEKDLRAMDYAASLAKTIPDRAAPRIKSGRPPSVPLY
jgi:hypothetical protein